MELVKKRPAPKKGLPTDGIMILVGLPKSGKTRTAASWPDGYVLELEPGGADRIEGRIHDIKSLEEFREVLKLAVADPSVRTIVVDSVDVLSDWLEDEIAHSAGLSSMTERKQGVDGWALWAELKRRLEALVNYLKASRKFVILIAHTKDPKLDSSGAVIIPAGMNVSGKGASVIAANADAIGNCFKKQIGATTKYFLSFQGGSLGIWGSRIPELEDKTIELPAENPYAAFEAIFKNAERENK
ncbi:MAG: AAA family ATPase [Elusimicrobia bacterium]|nr:AAA family ATPase [Elusimicrobiota bacterium]